jgi:hypothetical protein
MVADSRSGAETEKLARKPRHVGQRAPKLTTFIEPS